MPQIKLTIKQWSEEKGFDKLDGPNRSLSSSIFCAREGRFHCLKQVIPTDHTVLLVFLDNWIQKQNGASALLSQCPTTLKNYCCSLRSPIERFSASVCCWPFLQLERTSDSQHRWYSRPPLFCGGSPCLPQGSKPNFHFCQKMLSGGA